MTTDTETTQGVVPQWTVGDRIAKARHHARLTLRELAEPLSVTHATVSNWERDISPPRPIFLREIARLTGVDADWLENGDGPRGTRSRYGSASAPRGLPGADGTVWVGTVPLGELAVCHRQRVAAA
jgi:transcriptional regulator with XRE-family HTH domain